MARDGSDARLRFLQVHGAALAELTSRSDLVIAATGYRANALRLLPVHSRPRADGSIIDNRGRALPGMWAIGLGSGSRRTHLSGGEPSYVGPVDGVWHYQSVVAPAIVRHVFDSTPRAAQRSLSG
jgi:hypothetical protein